MRGALMDRFSIDGGDTRVDFSAWQALGHDAHSFLAAPGQLFVAPAAGDFHLLPGGPADDAGTTLPDVPTDLAGLSRPQGPAFDVGLFEVPGGEIFSDGFESGNLAAWSAAQP